MSPGDFFKRNFIPMWLLLCVLILFLNSLDGDFIILYEFTIIIYDWRIFLGNLMIIVGRMR